MHETKGTNKKHAHMYLYIYICGRRPTTRTPLKNTVNTVTNTVFFSESNFGAVSTDWKHRCKTQKKPKIQKPNDPTIKNPKIQKQLQDSVDVKKFWIFVFFGFLVFSGFLDFWIIGILDFCFFVFLAFWLFCFLDFWNVGFLDACILDPLACGYLHTRNCISVYRRCQG